MPDHPLPCICRALTVLEATGPSTGKLAGRGFAAARGHSAAGRGGPAAGGRGKDPLPGWKPSGPPVPDLARTHGLVGNERRRPQPLSAAAFAERFSALLEGKDQAVFAELDLDHDALLSSRELAGLVAHLPEQMDYASFSKWYHLRGNGKVSDALFQDLDGDGDEKLTHDELSALSSYGKRKGATQGRSEKRRDGVTGDRAAADAYEARPKTMDQSAFLLQFGPRLRQILATQNNAAAEGETDQSNDPSREAYQLSAIFMRMDQDRDGGLSKLERFGLEVLLAERADSSEIVSLTPLQQEVSPYVALRVLRHGWQGPQNLEQFESTFGPLLTTPAESQAHSTSAAAVFHALDTDGDGQLMSADRGGLKRFAPGPSWRLSDFRRWHFDLFPSVFAVTQLFSRLDLDGDEMLTAEEAAPVAAELFADVTDGRQLSPDLVVGDPLMGLQSPVYIRKYGHLLVGVSSAAHFYDLADANPKNDIVTPSEHRAALDAHVPTQLTKVEFEKWFDEDKARMLQTTADALFAQLDRDSSASLSHHEMVTWITAAADVRSADPVLASGAKRKLPGNPMSGNGLVATPKRKPTVSIAGKLGVPMSDIHAKLTAAGAGGGGPDVTEKIFKLLDADGSDRLTPNELAVAKLLLHEL
eukprot:SAG31_NODE_3770_length_3900_cov_4.289924_3_plen_643_part_00